MPFFNSLVFTGSRVAGQRERRVQQFECSSGLAFPEDYVTTQAYDQQAKDAIDKERARWERTPPAKRVNFEAVEPPTCRTPNYWNPDWHSLVSDPTTQGDSAGFGSVMIPTQPLEDAMEGVQTSSTEGDVVLEPLEQLWLLQGSDASSIIEELLDLDPSDVEDTLLARVNALRQKRGLSDPLRISSSALHQTALVSVSVNIIHRGSPMDFAVLYAPKPQLISSIANRKYSVEDEHSVRFLYPLQAQLLIRFT